ncbi:hypothetical protein BJ875DRAFT_438993 [Amylocarpus encephaloides]|uniref:Uncharacterized protein n=1 Tax=Amylocarpus encephaloides TaxID=45428 RepID=A0A9P7YP56_9HELO|nr:hypothetical protein BJ875DRAFT_438993 [Amylocarpus encephaloides]
MTDSKMDEVKDDRKLKGKTNFINSDKYKNAKAKMKLRGKLLYSWVSDGIKIKIKDFKDAKVAYDFIKKRYAATIERARDNLLNQLNGLKLDDYSSMTEYTNRIRSTKPDDPPDLNYLYERLHTEEAKQLRMKEDRKVREKARKETSVNNSGSSTTYSSRPKQNRKDKSHLKYTYSKCDTYSRPDSLDT